MRTTDHRVPRVLSAFLRHRPILTAALLLALSAAAQTVPAPDPSAAAPAEWSDDLSAIGPADWSYERAAHLIERAGFGAPPEEVARLAALTPRQAVDELVDYESIRDDLKLFDESSIWDPGMDPFPPSRAEAV